MIGRILTSTLSGDLVFSSLGLGQASFDLRVKTSFLMACTGKEKELIDWVRRLISSSRSSELSLKTPQKRSDTITYLHFLQASVWSDAAALFSESFLIVHPFLLAKCDEGWRVGALGRLFTDVRVFGRGVDEEI